MFTLDMATDWGKVRYLIGDTNAAKPNFQDEELQGFLNIDFVAGSLFLAASTALESLAAKASIGLQNITLGSLRIDQASKVKALQDMADKYRQLEYDTPAMAVVEENLSGFNELQIVRNWVLRTEF